jgi:hypothetical protein
MTRVDCGDVTETTDLYGTPLDLSARGHLVQITAERIGPDDPDDEWTAVRSSPWPLDETGETLDELRFDLILGELLAAQCHRAAK